MKYKPLNSRLDVHCTHHTSHSLVQQDESQPHCFKPSSKLLSMARTEQDSSEDALLRIISVTEWILVNLSQVHLTDHCVNSPIQQQYPSTNNTTSLQSEAHYKLGNSNNNLNNSKFSCNNHHSNKLHHHHTDSTDPCSLIHIHGQWRHGKDCYNGSDSVTVLIHETCCCTRDDSIRALHSLSSSSQLLVALGQEQRQQPYLRQRQYQAQQRLLQKQKQQAKKQTMVKLTTSLWNNEKYRVSFSSICEQVYEVSCHSPTKEQSCLRSECSEHVLRFDSLNESYVITLPSISYSNNNILPSNWFPLFSSSQTSKHKPGVNGTLEVNCRSSGFRAVVHFKRNHFQGAVFQQNEKGALVDIGGSLNDRVQIISRSTCIPFDKRRVDIAKDFKEYFCAKLFPIKPPDHR